MSNSAIDAIRQERDALLAQIRSLQDQLAGLDRALTILEEGADAPAAPSRPAPRNAATARGTSSRGSSGSRSSSSSSRRRTGSSGRPRNQSLVLQFLNEAREQGVSVNEVLERGSAAGIPLARASISSLLSRLKRQGRVSGEGGRYILAEYAGDVTGSNDGE